MTFSPSFSCWSEQRRAHSPLHILARFDWFSFHFCLSFSRRIFVYLLIECDMEYVCPSFEAKHTPEISQAVLYWLLIIPSVVSLSHSSAHSLSTLGWAAQRRERKNFGYSHPTWEIVIRIIELKWIGFYQLLKLYFFSGWMEWQRMNQWIAAAESDGFWGCFFFRWQAA